MRQMRWWLLILALTASGVRAQETDLSGNWRIVVERPGWQPRLCKGRLTLKRANNAWSGTLAFDTILFARPHELVKLEVTDGKVSFGLAVQDQRLAFRCELRGKELVGKCAWNRVGDFSVRASREKPAEPVLRFEPGLEAHADLPRAKAEDVGLDGALVDRLIRVAAGNGTDALMIVKDGKEVAARTFGGAVRPIHIMSVTKFLTAMAIAYLVDEKKIESLDVPLSNWFPEWKRGNRATVTLRHVLTHTSGIHHERLAHKLNAEQDKVAYVRKAKLDTKPGEAFAYNNDAVALLSGVITAAAGKPADEYLDERLFAPLGITGWKWDRDASGNTITYAQCALSMRDLARIGVMLTQGGKWKGRVVFPAGWIEKLGAAASEQDERCGLLWWRLPARDEVGHYHTGWLGQFLVVFPESKLVAIRLREADGSESPERSFGSFLDQVARLRK